MSPPTGDSAPAILRCQRLRAIAGAGSASPVPLIGVAVITVAVNGAPMGGALRACPSGAGTTRLALDIDERLCDETSPSPFCGWHALRRHPHWYRLGCVRLVEASLAGGCGPVRLLPCWQRRQHGGLRCFDADVPA